MDDGGFLTADRGPQTAKVILADGPIPWLSSFLLASIPPPCFHPSSLLPSLLLASIPPPVVIPETGGLDLYMIKNALSARYPGSRQEYLYRTTEWDHGRWTGSDDG